MAHEFPVLWGRANALLLKLVFVRKDALALLPGEQASVPAQYEDLHDEEAKRHLINYIRLRSVFGFAGRIGDLVNDACQKLVNAVNEQDAPRKEECQAQMERLLERVERILYGQIAGDNVTGLLRLWGWYEWLGRGVCDFKVMDPGLMFGDIMGIIQMQGPGSEALWRAVKEDHISESADLNGFLFENLVRIRSSVLSELHDQHGLMLQTLTNIERFERNGAAGSIEAVYRFRYNDKTKPFGGVTLAEVNEEGKILRIIKTK